MCSSANSFPLSIGPYFNFGAYEVTPFTYVSILVESKSKNMTGAWVPATRIGPVLKQHKKSTETYETVIKCIAKNCKLEEKGELSTATNGEVALNNACQAVFNQCTLLRCTRHFKVNCRECLKKLGISSSLKEVSIK